MKRFLDELIDSAKAHGAEVHVIEVNENPNESRSDEVNEVMAEAQHIAKMDKMLFDAYVREGFSEGQAFELVCAHIEG